MSITSRTYGWIQNPSDFQKLKTTVQIFDNESKHYKNLKENLIKNTIVHFPEINNRFQKLFNENQTIFTYKDLVGNSRDKYNKRPKSRSDAEANALIQISLLPQNYRTTGKNYTDDWTSDGFLRWAVSLGFLETDRIKDTYQLTDFGKEFSISKEGSEEELEILRKAFLSYPPATRVLEILNDSKEPQNKFYIGNKLGFIGERGFTSYDEEIMIDYLLSVEKKKQETIRRDVEGTSDKYARMIAGWLTKVGFIETEATKINETTSFQKYRLTGLGIHKFRQSLGVSSNKRQQKYIMWEFLATKGKDKEYVRTRRAHIIKNIQSPTSFQSLIANLRSLGFDDEEIIIQNDLDGLINFGLRIEQNNTQIKLLDAINNFDIPDLALTQLYVEKSRDAKKAFFLKNTNLKPKYLELLEIAYDGHASRDFEILTTELFKEIYTLKATHLGGGRKPDGIAYTPSYGIIYDTKAYSKGYGKNIGQADAMIRYINDNVIDSPERNDNLWWRAFPDTITEDNYYFLWISSEFKGKFEEQIEYVSSDTSVKGGALSVEQLLLGANNIQKGHLLKEDIPNYINNKEIIFEKKEA